MTVPVDSLVPDLLAENVSIGQALERLERLVGGSLRWRQAADGSTTRDTDLVSRVHDSQANPGLVPLAFTQAGRSATPRTVPVRASPWDSPAANAFASRRRREGLPLHSSAPAVAAPWRRKPLGHAPSRSRRRSPKGDAKGRTPALRAGGEPQGSHETKA